MVSRRDELQAKTNIFGSFPPAERYASANTLPTFGNAGSRDPPPGNNTFGATAAAGSGQSSFSFGVGPRLTSSMRLSAESGERPNPFSLGSDRPFGVPQRSNVFGAPSATAFASDISRPPNVNPPRFHFHSANTTGYYPPGRDEYERSEGIFTRHPSEELMCIIGNRSHDRTKEIPAMLENMSEEKKSSIKKQVHKELEDLEKKRQELSFVSTFLDPVDNKLSKLYSLQKEQEENDAAILNVFSKWKTAKAEVAACEKLMLEYKEKDTKLQEQRREMLSNMSRESLASLVLDKASKEQLAEFAKTLVGGVDAGEDKESREENDTKEENDSKEENNPKKEKDPKEEKDLKEEKDPKEEVDSKVLSEYQAAVEDAAEE